MRRAIQVFGNTISILLATISLYNVMLSSSSLVTTGSASSRLVSATFGTGKAAGATGEVAASNDLLVKSVFRKAENRTDWLQDL